MSSNFTYQLIKEDIKSLDFVIIMLFDEII